MLGTMWATDMPDKPGLLSLYSDVQTKPVNWLWFP